MRELKIKNDYQEVWPFNIISNLYNCNAYAFHAPIEPIDQMTANDIFDAIHIRLTDREKLVIKWYFQDRKTLDQIAEPLGIKRERVRQIRLKAQRKISYYVNKRKESEELSMADLKSQIEIYERFLKGEGVIAEQTIKTPKPYTISDLDLPVRPYNCLCRAGIRTIEDLLSKTTEDLFRIRNFGKGCMRDLIKELNANGIVHNFKEEREQ